MTPFLNMSKQIKTTVKEAENFLVYMEGLGYKAHRVVDLYRTDVHFTKDGKTSLNQGVTFFNGEEDENDEAYIMVRF